VKSLHSSRSLLTESASGQRSAGSFRKLATHSYPLASQPIREESHDALISAAKASKTHLSSVATATKNQDAENEFLLRRESLGEFDPDDLAALRQKFGGDNAKDRKRQGLSASPEAVDAAETGVGDIVQGTRPSHTDRPISDIETLRTYSSIDAWEARKRQRQLGQKIHQEQERQKQEAEEEEAHIPIADNRSAKKTTVVAIPDGGKLVPLSKSAIRASDVVTVDILDRAISDDLRQFPTTRPDCLCVLAAIIVSRVLDSARSKVMRESRMPPAKTWTEQAQREALLLAEDVVSSAVIYVSRGGTVTSTSRPHDAVHAVRSASTDEEPSTPEHLLKQPTDVLWDKHYDDQDAKNAEDKDVSDEDAQIDKHVNAQSLLEAHLSIIETQHTVLPGHKTVQENEPELKANTSITSDEQQLSLAQLSIIEIPQPASSGREEVEEDEDVDENEGMQEPEATTILDLYAQNELPLTQFTTDKNSLRVRQLWSMTTSQPRSSIALKNSEERLSMPEEDPTSHASLANQPRRRSSRQASFLWDNGENGNDDGDDNERASRMSLKDISDWRQLFEHRRRGSRSDDHDQPGDM